MPDYEIGERPPGEPIRIEYMLEIDVLPHEAPHEIIRLTFEEYEACKRLVTNLRGFTDDKEAETA